MPLSENVLEEILFTAPGSFFPDHDLRRYARQLRLGPIKGGGCIDVAFKDESTGELWLVEIKAAGKAKVEVVEQVSRYLAEMERLRPNACECPFPAVPKAIVVAPDITETIKTELTARNISYFEFPESMFERAAKEHGLALSLASAPGLRLDYWTAMQRHLMTNAIVGLNVTPKESNNVTACRAAGLDLTLRCSTDHNCLDVDLTFGTKTAHLFPKFCERRADIDAEAGQTVLWFKQGSERHIRIQHWANVRERSSWPEFHRWMAEMGSLLARHAKSISRGY